MPNTADVVSNALRPFWQNWKFWAFASVVIVMSMLTGYLIAGWTIGSQAKLAMARQEQAYMEASTARKTTLDTCLDNNRKLTNQLAGLGFRASDAANEASNAAKTATEALKKIEN